MAGRVAETSGKAVEVVQRAAMRRLTAETQLSLSRSGRPRLTKAVAAALRGGGDRQKASPRVRGQRR